MKIFNKFIWSKKEPSNKNDIWFDGSTWRMYTEEAWQSFTLPVDAADEVTKVIEKASEVYQEKLNAGYGIVIEGNTISVDDSIKYDDSDVWEAIETLQQNKVEQIQLNDYVPLDRYASTSQVLMDNISELTSTKLNKTDVATINGQSLIEGGNIVIGGGESSHNIGSIDLFEQIIAQKQNHDLTLEDKEAILNGKVITTSVGNGTVPTIGITSIEGLGLMLMFHFNERLYSMCVMWNNDRCYVNGFFSFSRHAKFFADSELSETSENSVQNKVVTEKLAELSAEVSEVSAEVLGQSDYVDEDLSLVADAYYDTGSSTILTRYSPYAGSGYYCADIAVTEGEKLRIYGRGGSYAVKMYGFADASNNAILFADNAVDYSDGHEIVVPKDAVRMVVNFKAYNPLTDKLQRYNLVQGLIDYKPILQDSSFLGKTIVCFGDSITEMKDVTNGKSYTDVLHDITGANFINVGVGGSQIRRRTVIFEEFSASKSYAVGDFCLYDDGEKTRIYQFTSAHNGAWSATDVKEFAYQSMVYSNLDVFSLIQASANKDYGNAIAACRAIVETQNDDNTKAITRLASVDWSKVDAITIFAGTNDWYDPNTLGVKGSTDQTKTLGAINEIIRIFNSAYPHIKVYWFTPIVRWLAYNNGSTNDAQFSDNYSVEGNGTLKEECSAIIEEVTSNHIPICDFYNNFGWNKYNCTEYFTGADGTHPRTAKGVKYIAEKMLRFLLANKTF